MGSTIVNLLKETRTRIRYLPDSNDGSKVAILTGRQEDVNAAVTRLDKLQKSMVGPEYIVLTFADVIKNFYEVLTISFVCLR